MAPGVPGEFWTWLFASIFGLGVLSCIPVWVRGRARRQGRVGDFDENDVLMRNVMCTLLTVGIGGLLARALNVAMHGH